MTSLLLFLKHRFPFLWRLVEWTNGVLFGLRYPRFAAMVNDALGGFTLGGFLFSPVEESDIALLSEFLTGQPAERIAHFDPHGFDCRTLHRLLENRAFAMMKVTDAGGTVAGYFFLRCFFIGRAFHGLIVGEEFAGRGIGTAMWSLSARICDRTGLRMFATVSAHNEASLTSAHRGSEVEVVEMLANDYLLLECRMRQ